MHPLYIKNMVCHRCILAVTEVMKKLNLQPVTVHLGMVELANAPGTQQLQALKAALHQIGFEVLDNQQQKLIEKIKNALIQKVQSGEVEDHFSISDYVSKLLHKDYSAVSRLFSELEGITLEKFFIQQKTEKVKEWLVYGELSLGEIAFRLGYSSVAHLSAQFKKVTGLTPSHFKTIGAAHRKSLDKI